MLLVVLVWSTSSTAPVQVTPAVLPLQASPNTKPRPNTLRLSAAGEAVEVETAVAVADRRLYADQTVIVILCAVETLTLIVTVAVVPVGTAAIKKLGPKVDSAVAVTPPITQLVTTPVPR